MKKNITFLDCRCIPGPTLCVRTASRFPEDPITHASIHPSWHHETAATLPLSSNSRTTCAICPVNNNNNNWSRTQPSFCSTPSWSFFVADNLRLTGRGTRRHPRLILLRQGQGELDVELLDEQVVDGGAVAEVDPVADGCVLLLVLAARVDDVIIALGA